MLGSASLDSMLDVVFEELIEEFAITNSGELFIQLLDRRVLAFGLRPKSEWKQTGLSDLHQKSLCNMIKQCLRQKRNWPDGELLVTFGVSSRLLHAVTKYKRIGY
ncbi:hypothetical protein [Paenibacillus koleovorans]|uniref:hypothetical protein n=1 Tax=Paenibacillus koleovorans TaxID=121608 RepID=UPI000FD9E0A1|nr:hypothetical protein [Paenibacillus koleovorans]